jgi:inner membrane protein
MPRRISPFSDVGGSAPELEPENRARLRDARSRWPGCGSPRAFVAAVVGLGLADWAFRLAGDSFFPGGPLDETAHLLTALIVLWALGRRACDRFLIPALVASVAIDLDHVPGQLGHYFLTRGTSRPYTHSLLSVVVVLAVSVLWRSRRDVMLGIAIGLAIHFWRDMAEGDAGVALLWPFSDHSFRLAHAVYLIVMALFAAGAATRCRQRRLARRDGSVPEGAGSRARPRAAEAELPLPSE